MRRQDVDYRPTAVDQPAITIGSDRRDRSLSEDIFIRSYDQQTGYDIEVEVEDRAGQVVFRHRYYIRPCQTEHVSNEFDPGAYEIRVRVDNGEETARRCRIGDTLEGTAVIEVGNGALSLTEGLHH